MRSNFHNYVNVIKYLRMVKFALSPEPRLSQSGHKRTGRNELPGDVGSARTWSEVGSATSGAFWEMFADLKKMIHSLCARFKCCLK